jgi:amino acid adenylation domain-containing protein
VIALPIAMPDGRDSAARGFSCLLLGNEPLVTRAATLLGERGHSVIAVVTDSAAVRRWCEEAGVPSLTRHEYPKFLEERPIDLLLSITYPWRIPIEMIIKARRAAVNYHDGPLPHCAGMNASAWSICSGESRHTIVWHRLIEGLDAGEILERRDIELDSRETSLSLNMSNAVLALESFRPLVERLERGDLSGSPQDPLVGRTVFPRHDRPGALCTLDLDESAVIGDRLIRACTFGQFDNRFGLVKLVNGDRAVIVHEAHLALGEANGEAIWNGNPAAGTVLAIDNEALTVACGVGALRCRRFSTLLGAQLSPSQAAVALGVSVGAKICDSRREERRAISRSVAEAEPYFVSALNGGIPVALPFELSTPSVPREVPVEVPQAFRRRFGEETTDAWITAFSLVLSALARQDSFDLALVDERAKAAIGASEFLFFPSLPLRVTLEQLGSFSAAREAVGAARAVVVGRGAFLNDLIVRNPSLASQSALIRGELSPVAVLLGNVEVPRGTTLALKLAGEEVSVLTDGRVGEARLVAIAHELYCIAGAAGEDPQRALQELDLLDSETFSRQVFAWNNTARAFPDTFRIHDLFEQRVVERPDAIALVFEGEARTFREVEAAANRMANALLSRGVKPGSLVGISLDRSFDLVIAMLAVVKAGAAYVPLDVAYPSERVRFMLEDAACALLLTSSDRASGFDPAFVLAVDTLEVTAASSERPPCPSQASDVCYVIYTSGSTGQPKGVVLSHRAVVNTLDWVNRVFQMTSADRLLFVTSPSFDLSVYDVFGALGAGASVEIASSALLADPGKIARKLCDPGITVWDSAPAALTRLAPFLPEHAPASSLRLVMLSGDWIPITLPPLLKRTFPGTSVESLGGATEAAIWSNHHAIRDLDPSWVSIPYGRPIQNARYYVLDRRRRPVPFGIAGDLYIAGACLAEGYLHRPELNAERFLADPFRAGERMYKTGDLARYFPDGVMEFLGRADFQAKIRGFRVELGEVEHAITKVAGVREVVCHTYIDASGTKSLAAYVVPNHHAIVDEKTIKAALGRALPEFMVPSHVLILSALPVTANGKIDRQALPSPTARVSPSDVVAPRTKLEERLVVIWEELLERKPIGVTDDFFALGGHSLLAVMLVTALKSRLGISVPLSRVLEQPTIAAFASTITNQNSHGRRSRNLLALHASGTKPPLVLVAGIGGYTFTYRNFPKLLGGDQPVFTFMAVGAEDPDDPVEHSIEHVAELYEEELSEAVPAGPLVVGGFSSGALPAFELARRLIERRREVPLFVSFDGFAPGYPSILPIFERIAAHVRELISRDGPGRRAYLRDRVSHVRRRVYAALGRLEELAPAVPFTDPNMSDHMKKLWVHHLRASHRYSTRARLPCDLLLVRAARPYQWVATKMDDPNYGWARYVSGEISVVTVPGQHTDLFAAASESLIAQAVSAHVARYTHPKVQTTRV